MGGCVQGKWREVLGAMVLLLVAGSAAAQAPPDRVKVFLDCQTRGCDRQGFRSEFRTEIQFVDWVNERTAADVHVILTSQDTGAGNQYVFDYIGIGDLEGSDFRIEETALNTDTRDEVLDGLVRSFKAGLVQYVARRGYLDELDIRAVDGNGESRPPVPEDDPWNLWVFTVGLNGEADGEEQQRSYEIGTRASASRTTPLWKIALDLDGEVEYDEFELSEGTFTDRAGDWRFDVLAARSLTDHWSAGGFIDVNSSTRLNRDVGARVAAALEANIFPYEVANRRQFIFHYQLGVARVRYDELTIFEKLEETLYDQRLAAVYDTRQPWGNVSFSAAWSNYLHDWSKYRVSTRLGASFRLFRGLELDIRGNYQVIRDQLYLPAEALSDEEILVQRRRLATGYEYGIDLGISYRFGSIYNSVVNNRFPWSVRRAFNN